MNEFDPNAGMPQLETPEERMARESGMDSLPENESDIATAMAMQDAINKQTRVPAAIPAPQDIPDDVKQFVINKANNLAPAPAMEKPTEAPKLDLSALLASIGGQDINKDPQINDAELKAAQRERSMNEAQAGFTMAGKLALANSVPGFKLTMDDYKAELEQAKRPTEDVMQRQDLKKSNSGLDNEEIARAKAKLGVASDADVQNPKSEASSIARDLASQFLGKPVPETFTAEQLNRLLPGLQQKSNLDFKKEEMDARRMDRADSKADRAAREKELQTLRKDKMVDESSVAQKAVDKDYAKSYNTFTQKGAVNAETAIKNLEKLSGEMEADTGIGEAGGGRLATMLPDSLRARDAVRRRDQARNFANTTLKELFGGQLSDAEREAAAKEYYNDALDNKTNSEILRGKIGQLRDTFKTEEAKAKYYEDKGTLKGFKGISQPTVIPGKTSKPKTVMQNGHTYTLNEATGEYE